MLPRISMGSFWLKQRIQKLNYKPCKLGICHGYSDMEMLAFLANELPLSNKRLSLIHQTPVNDFAIRLTKLHESRTMLIYLIKRKFSKDFDLLNKEEFAQSPEVREKITALEKIYDDAFVEKKSNIEFEKRKNDILYNAFLQKKIDEIFNTLPENTRLALDIQPFFDGLVWSQEPGNYPGISMNKLNQDTIQSSPLIMLKKLEDIGIARAKKRFSSMYDIASLISYFESFRIAFSSINSISSYPVVLSLDDSTHNIKVGFKNDQWTLLDSEYADLGKQQLANSKDIAEVVMRSLKVVNSTNKNITQKCVFSTQLFGTKDIELQLNELLECWREQDSWKASHQIPTKTIPTDDIFYASLWLYISTAIGQIEVVKALLAVGADPNQARFDGVTALMLAAQQGYLEITQVLLAAGAAPNQARTDGVTALILAAQQGYLEITQALLAAGADPKQAGSNGVTALMLAAQHGYLEITQALLAAGADPKQARSDGVTALILAVDRGYFEITQALLAAGADPKQAGSNGMTALMLAADSGYFEIVKLLTFFSDSVNEIKFIPLHQSPHALFKSKPKAIEIDTLLKKHKLKDGSSSSLALGIRSAAHNNQLEDLKLFIELGADLNAKDGNPTQGYTALHRAAIKGHKECFDLLLAEGANPDIEDVNGKKAYDHLMTYTISIFP